MARPRLTLERARAIGADVINPGRFRGRSDPAGEPLGEAAPWLDDDTAAAWACFRRELPWLRESDRAIVDIASLLRAHVQATADINAMTQLRLCLSAMGATPTDRSKISMPAANDDDPASEFFN